MWTQLEPEVSTEGELAQPASTRNSDVCLNTKSLLLPAGKALTAAIFFLCVS